MVSVFWWFSSWIGRIAECMEWKATGSKFHRNPWKQNWFNFHFSYLQITSQNQSTNYFITLFFLCSLELKCTHHCNVFFRFKRLLSILFLLLIHAKKLKMRNQIVFGLGMLTCMDWERYFPCLRRTCNYSSY